MAWDIFFMFSLPNDYCFVEITIRTGYTKIEDINVAVFLI